MYVYTYTSACFGRVFPGTTMSMNERDEEQGWGAVEGTESHESEETLTEEERGEKPEPPEYVPPVEPPPER